MPRWPQVSPGDPLAIPAPTFNAMVDAARAHHARKQLPGMVDPRTAPNDYVVRIKNSSGEDVPRYGILAIDGLVITPDDNDAILDDPLLDGTNTTTTDDKIAVVLQPLADGEIGTAVIGGVIACTINVSDELHTYAEPSTEAAATGVTRLESSSSGYIRILWKGSGTGEVDALVTFPHTPTAAVATQFAMGDGNDITPSGYSADTYYGIKVIASPLTTLPAASPPSSPTPGAYADGLSWATNKSTGDKVWIAAYVQDSDGTNHEGVNMTLPEDAAVWSFASITMNVSGGGTATCHIIGAV